MVVIFAGIIHFFIELFSEREFEQGLDFINQMSNEAPPLVSELWKRSKQIAFLLFIQLLGIMGFEGFGFLFQNWNLSNKSKGEILFNGIIFILGLSAIIVIIAVTLKYIINENGSFSAYKNRHYGFRIEIPPIWKEEKIPKDSIAVIGFSQPSLDKACFVFADKKNNWDNSASLEDFYKCEFDSFSYPDEIEIKKIEKIEDEIDYYKIDTYIRKRKYVTYFYFLENNKVFYEVRIIVPRKNNNLEEVKKILKSFKLI